MVVSIQDHVTSPPTVHIKKALALVHSSHSKMSLVDHANKKGIAKNLKRDNHTSISAYITPLNTPLKRHKSMKRNNRFVLRHHGYNFQLKDTISGDLVILFS